MTKPKLPVVNHCLGKRGAARRWLAQLAVVLLCVAALLAMDAAVRPTRHGVAAAVPPAAAAAPGVATEKPKPPHILPDPVYDHFVQQVASRSWSSGQRQYLETQLLAAATDQRVDPDLLFAIVAVESNFNSQAVSSKGARGLGQLMFPTAHAVAPQMVRRPADLFNIHRNLFATSLELRRLLDKWGGDLRAVLMAYLSGEGARFGFRHAPGPYVARICMYYALLKTQRDFRKFAATRGASPAGVTAG